MKSEGNRVWQHCEWKSADCECRDEKIRGWRLGRPTRQKSLIR